MINNDFNRKLQPRTMTLKDYFYFDSQVYKKVLTEKDFNAMKSDMAKSVASVIGQLIDESGLNNNSK